MAEINVPAPNAMITPSKRLLKDNLEAITPPMTSDEVANRPHKNAFNIKVDFLNFGRSIGPALMILKFPSLA